MTLIKPGILLPEWGKMRQRTDQVNVKDNLLVNLVPGM